MKSYRSKEEYFPKMEVRQAIHNGIVRATKEKERDAISRCKRRTFTTFAIVATLFIVSFGTSYVSPSMAESLAKIPVIGSIFDRADMPGLQVANKERLSSIVGETKTINGISVTLQELIYDQNNVSVGLLIESDKELDDHYFGSGPDITIDGKTPEFISGSYGEEVVSATTRTAIQQITVTKDMPASFELDLTLLGKNGEEWQFTTPIEQIDGIQRILLDHTEEVDGVHLTVHDIAISKTGVSLTFESDEKAKDFSEARGRFIEFHIEDDHGNEIGGIKGGVQGEVKNGTYTFYSTKQFEPLENNVAELTITPYVDTSFTSGGVEIDESGKREIVEEGSNVKPVKFEPFTVTTSHE